MNDGSQELDPGFPAFGSMRDRAFTAVKWITAMITAIYRGRIAVQPTHGGSTAIITLKSYHCRHMWSFLRSLHFADRLLAVHK